MKFGSFRASPQACKQIAQLFGGGPVPACCPHRGGSAQKRKALARLIAQALVCTSSGEHPCGKCAACQKAAAQAHPDIFEAEGGEAARSFHIETVREVREDVFILPNEASYKAYLLLNAQSMSRRRRTPC